MAAPQSRRTGLVLGALLLALLAGGTAMLLRSDDPAVVEVAEVPTDSAPAPVSAPVPDDAAALTPWNAEDSSLRGSQSDGHVTFSAHGHLIVDRDLRAVFDHFLSLLGEQDLAQIRAHLRQHLQDSYPGQDHAQVLELFERYVAYLRASEQLRSSGDLRARHEDLKELRRRTLGDGLADAFFAAEEAHVDWTLENLRIASDPALDEASRQAALDRHAENLPEAERGHRHDSEVGVLAEQQSQLFEELQADPQTRFEERAALFGADAATRLGELDRQRADWARRLQQYREARARIQADPAMDPDARSSALQALLQSSFEAHERRRIEALERIDQGG